MGNNQSTTYQWIAGILAIILLVVGVSWLLSEPDYEEVTDDFNENLISYRAKIAEECKVTATTTAAQKQKCNDTLDELEDILSDFSAVLDTRAASTTPTEKLPITTPTSTATSTATSS